MVEPLKSRTMGLSELQFATLELIRKVRFQFRRQAHEDGMSDEEFMSQVVEPFEHRIYADRAVLRDKRKRGETA